jgi:hypothetical protein
MLPHIMLANVYIDGFNLYYGALKGTNYKWLDLGRLCRILLPKDEINHIRYFTAPVSARPNDPQQPLRQDIYLQALTTIPNLTVHLGRFLVSYPRMRLRQPKLGLHTVEVVKTEEKGSDVNLATYLLLDAFRQRCEVAVVITNDSDLTGPIAVVQRELGLPVGIINPQRPHLRSRDLLDVAFFKQLRASALARSQFPDELISARGDRISKPAGW